MPADPLGGRMHDDVRPVVDRPAEGAGGAEGVVHDQRDSGRVGDVGQGLEVGYVEPGVADGLDEEEAGAAVDGRRAPGRGCGCPRTWW